MPFLTNLDVREWSDSEWELLAPLEYTGHTDTFTVPVGFHTDFATVPRIFWPLVGPAGRHTKSAVLHDWLYVEQPIVQDDRGPAWRRRISRLEADGIFRRTLREQGVGRLKRWAMYRAVRAFGGKMWKESEARRQSAR